MVIWTIAIILTRPFGSGINFKVETNASKNKKKVMRSPLMSFGRGVKRRGLACVGGSRFFLFMGRRASGVAIHVDFTSLDNVIDGECTVHRGTFICFLFITILVRNSLCIYLYFTFFFVNE